MQVIVVLGCSVVYNSSREQYNPGQILQMRLDRAVQLYLKLYSDDLVIVVSGRKGTGDDYSIDDEGHGITEASVMKRYLIDQGIPDCRIFEENKSRNTIENCLMTYQLLLELEKELTLYDLNCNFDMEQYGELGPVEHIYVVTSDFHLPRTEKIFSHFLKHIWKLHFVPAPTPSEIREQVWAIESRIDVNQWLTAYIRQVN